MNRKKVAVGLSGGVDSAVCALLLKEAGFDVVGVHLYCWPPKSEIEKDGVTREEWIKKNGCRADEDRASALKTALEVGIPFKMLDFSEEYNQKVINYFYDQYEEGRTPNPDVLCNSEIKFGLFLSWALNNGFDYIATGHYAKLETVHKDGKIRIDSGSEFGTIKSDIAVGFSGDSAIGNDIVGIKLMIPADKHKDQTYFLWKLTQKELAHVLFPLGELQKNEVRDIAKEAGLSVADKKDSQGICFVGNVNVKEFLVRRLAVKKGRVQNTLGKVVGEHDGVWFYTIGQRGGWRWSSEGQQNAARRKKEIICVDSDLESEVTRGSVGKDKETPIYYVISKDAKSNTLVVGEGKDAMNDFFEVSEVNLISQIRGFSIEKEKELYVRIRHGGELIGARVGEIGGNINVELVKPVRGIASGQSAVFYNASGECLGGGVIG